MTEAAIVFAVQFVYIALLAVQSLNTNNGHYAGAFCTSLVLGMIGYWLTTVVAAHRAEAIGSLVWFAYISGGPFGIVCAMRLHPYLVKRWRRTP